MEARVYHPYNRPSEFGRETRELERGYPVSDRGNSSLSAEVRRTPMQRRRMNHKGSSMDSYAGFSGLKTYESQTPPMRQKSTYSITPRHEPLEEPTPRIKSKDRARMHEVQNEAHFTANDRTLQYYKEELSMSEAKALNLQNELDQAMATIDLLKKKQDNCLNVVKQFSQMVADGEEKENVTQLLMKKLDPPKSQIAGKFNVLKGKERNENEESSFFNLAHFLGVKTKVNSTNEVEITFSNEESSLIISATKTSSKFEDFFEVKCLKDTSTSEYAETINNLKPLVKQDFSELLAMLSANFNSQ